MSSSSGGKDFEERRRRRNVFVGNDEDTEEKKKKKEATTTKDALERALSRHEKYVSSSSEGGRFAEDLGIIHLLSFFLSLL
jgi:hypothetical protein